MAALLAPQTQKASVPLTLATEPLRMIEPHHSVEVRPFLHSEQRSPHIHVE
jgi:hypothetical protein